MEPFLEASGRDSSSEPSLVDCQSRLQNTRAQVNEVVGIMCINVEKVFERDQQLLELNERVEQLAQGATQFEQHAVRLKRKHQWASMKFMLLIILIVVILLVILVTWLY